MRENIEFRIPEEFADEHFPDDFGVRLGTTVRKIAVDIQHPSVEKIGQLDIEREQIGRAFFTSWKIHRKYTRRELAEAMLLYVNPKKYFEPAGEECGTSYDDSTACPVCESGATQTTSLYLPAKRLPKRVDVAKTIADELIVSRSVVELFEEESVKGIEFEPVRLSDKKGETSDEWFQPQVCNPPVNIHPKTRAGSTPFDEMEYGKCDCGDLIGLNLISEPHIQADSYDGSEVVLTRQMTGVRRGLLRPHPLWLVTPRLWFAMQKRGIKGLKVERAHLL